MLVSRRAEKSVVSVNLVEKYLANRHATMIWAFILFSLVTTAPPNVSDNVDRVIWRGSISDEKGTCSRLDFAGYLRNSGSLLLPFDDDLPVFGPQLPPPYEQYRRHVESDYSNGTISRTGREPMVDDAIRTDHLEADLDRLLAQETKRSQNESAGAALGNGTATVDQQQPQQQEADIPLPSFNEWTKQKLEEQLQTKQQQQVDAQLKNGAANGSPSTPVAAPGSGATPLLDRAAKTVEHSQHARNYASKECNAKVLLANPQAQHASSVLNEKEPDEYMLNPCNAEQKFFVVELCETVQITRLDLANFELFSSSPKDFRVFVSERYPATEWTFLGAWTAEDQRKVQNFQVERRLYAKYVKVELLSHYGSEHFCPLSLIRVLGVSVVEEYEAEAAQEQLPQQPVIEPEALPIFLPAEPGEKADETTPSPFEPPVQKVENGNSTTPPPATAATPSESESKILIRQDVISSAKDVVVQMAKGVIGKAQAVFGGSKNVGNETAANDTAANVELELESVPPTVLPAAGPIYCSDQWRKCLMCDMSSNVSRRLCGYVRAFLVKRRPKIQQLNSTVSETVNVPTSVEPSENKKPQEEFAQAPVEEVPEGTAKEDKNQALTEAGQTANAKAPTPPAIAKVLPTPPPTATAYPSTGAVDSSSLPGVATTAKETVFARLNSRIRALETNISLSGEYLGELSLRYRKQMDEMQKALNRSNAALAQYTKTTDEKLVQYREDIELLQAELDKVKAQLIEYNGERMAARIRSAANESTIILEIEKTFSRAEVWAPVIAVVEIFVLAGIIIYCCRGRFGTDERVLEAMVERRVRQVMMEELRKLRKNGVNVVSLEMKTGNGHLPLDRSAGPWPILDSDEQSGAPDRPLEHRWLSSPEQCDDIQMPSTSAKHPQSSEMGQSACTNKAKKKMKKRQQQQQQQRIAVARKSSDQTSGFSSRRETRDEPPDDHDTVAMNDSSAGILFSTSNQSTPAWRRVLPTWRRTALPNHKGQKPRRRGSDDRLDTATKWMFPSQNAFQLLASPSSSESQSRSPEKRPQFVRGPS